MLPRYQQCTARPACPTPHPLLYRQPSYCTCLLRLPRTPELPRRGLIRIPAVPSQLPPCPMGRNSPHVQSLCTWCTKARSRSPSLCNLVSCGLSVCSGNSAQRACDGDRHRCRQGCRHHRCSPGSQLNYLYYRWTFRSCCCCLLHRSCFRHGRGPVCPRPCGRDLVAHRCGCRFRWRRMLARAVGKIAVPPSFEAGWGDECWPCG